MTRVGEVTVLGNPALPILEVNAAYSPVRIGQPLEQPILICPSGLDQSQLEGSDLEGFGLAGALVTLEVQITPVTSSIWVEQVAWTQAAQLARVWCERNDANDWLALTAREIARTLERDAELLAYLAYVSDEPVGMMIASSDGICGWWAGANDVARALFARGAQDLAKLEVTVPLARRHDFGAMETARFEIFVTGNSDHQSFEASR